MPWIDITRNLDTGNREKVVDLFEFKGVFYAIIKTYDAIPTDTSTVNTFDPGTYTVHEHLGADPPVVDIIWNVQPLAFPVFPTNRGYIPAGKAEDTTNGFIYLGNKDAGVVYVNSTAGLIDGNWDALAGPFGFDEFVDAQAGLRDITFYNNKLYAAHLGGVSAFNTTTKIWELAGLFTASPGSFGQATSLFGFQGELYVTVSYGDIGKVHKYNSSVTKPEDWILVGELPLTSLAPLQLAEYGDSLFLIAADPDKNVFDASQIDTTLTGQPRLFEGTHLSGVPTSIIKYRKDSKLWVTCAREEFSRRGYLKGDVNFDGKVDWDDVTVLTAHLFGGGNADFVASAAADVTFSDDLNIEDLTLLINYLTGTTPTLPGDSPVLIDTIGPNLITDLTLNRNPVSSVPLDAFNVESAFEVGFGNFTDPALAISRLIPYTINESTQSFIWDGQSGAQTENFDLMNTDTFLDPINIASSLLIGPITTRENIIYTITGDASVSYVRPARSDFSDAITSTVMRLRTGIVLQSHDRISGFVRGFSDLLLPWALTDISGLPANTPVNLALLNQHLSSSFNPIDFVGLPFFLDSDPDLYFRIDLFITNSSIGSGQPLIGIEPHAGVIVSGLPPPPTKYSHYRPSFRLDNFSGESSGVLPDVTYIVEARADIPGGFEDIHTIIPPSGPDEWFVKFERIVNGEGRVISTGGIPENFGGIVRSRLVTSGINFVAGESYEFNIVVKPRILGHTKDINLTINTPNTSAGSPIISYQSSLPVMRGGTRFWPIKHLFTVAEGLSAADLTNIPIFIEFAESHIFTGESALTSYEAIISDVNLVQKIDGSTVNSIHQYNGISWTSARSSMIDPILETDIPRTGLIDHFDLRSNEFQLYSHGGGRVWAWHYDGGLYSGSALGPRFDRRPQIVNIA